MMAEDTSASGDGSNPAELDAQLDETESQEQSSTGKTVSHQTYKKLVNEAKREREARRGLEAKFKELEDQRLADQGNKDELIKRLQAKADASEKRTKEIYGSYARKSLSQQMRSAAQEAGCIDPDAVMSLADLSSLDVDPDTFEASADDIKDVINGLKKTKAYLFQKAGPKVNAKLPNGQAAGVPDKPDFKGWPQAKIQAWLLEHAHLFK